MLKLVFSNTTLNIQTFALREPTTTHPDTVPLKIRLAMQDAVLRLRREDMNYHEYNRRFSEGWYRYRRADKKDEGKE